MGNLKIFEYLWHTVLDMFRLVNTTLVCYFSFCLGLNFAILSLEIGTDATYLNAAQLQNIFLPVVHPVQNEKMIVNYRPVTLGTKILRDFY